MSATDAAQWPPSDCEECGSSADVRRFYGRERCDKDDDWWACADCRWRYIRARMDGTLPERDTDGEADQRTDGRGDEPEPAGQRSLTDY